jgi:small-conductance mechanosensitive channel/CRP-like cAMP-binding protein
MTMFGGQAMAEASQQAVWLLAILAADIPRFGDGLLALLERDNVVQVACSFYAFAALLWLALHTERAHIRRTLWVFTFALLLLFASVVVAFLRLASDTNPLYWAGLMLGGTAMVNLLALVVFGIVLRPLHQSVPRIMRDLIVAAGYLAVGLTLLSRAGLSFSGLITTSAVLTAVIGFSLQDTLGNVMGGLALQTDKSIQVGDWIKVDQNVGRVTEIGWRHTAIETRNWETVIIPNSVLMKAQVVVLGRREEQPVQLRRWVYFNVDFRVSPTEVIQTVSGIFNGERLPGVAAYPEPNCLLYEFKESYCVYAVRYWLTDLANDDPTDSLVRTRIYFALKRAGIPLSIPAQSVFVTDDGQSHKLLKQGQELQHRLKALQRVELFQQLQEAELQHLAENLRSAPFAKGEIVTRQGAEAHWLYLITKGSVGVEVAVEGMPRRSIATLLAGDFFGEMSLLTGAKRSATVVALEDVECYRLDKEVFHEILQRRPEVADHISHILAQRQVELDAAREGLSAEAAQARVKHAQHDILGRIKSFFSLNNHHGGT